MPAFDFAWGYRGTLIYTTDPAYQVFEGGSAYPTTYTNANGLSINAGWTIAGHLGGNYNRVATNDPRIVGMAYISPNGSGVVLFQVDLSSGSAPGAGTYTVDLAVGDPLNPQREDFTLKDNTTLLIDGTNGAAGIDTTGNQFVDATLATVTGGAAWAGTTASKVFASTTVNLNVGPDACGGSTGLSHFRLTLQADVTDTPITPPTALRLAA